MDKDDDPASSSNPLLRSVSGDVPGSVPCYWINRTEDDLRRTTMTNWLDQSKIRHYRIEAITPQTTPEFKILKHHQDVATNLEVACIASHLKAVLQAWQDGAPYALIMEDDLRALYVYDYQQMVDLAPTDWETLQLHVSNPTAVIRLGNIFVKPGALWQEWERDNYSAGAYLINRRGMKKLIDLYLSMNGTLEQIDLSMIHAVSWVTSEFTLFKRTASYTITIPLFVHDPAMRSVVNPGKLPLYAKGQKAIERIVSRVQEGMKKKTAGDQYPFAIGRLETR
jgi:GR25 family glycosyltransferase involved in LPS biosynthesis